MKNNTPNEDYTAPGEEWSGIKSLIEKLTRQRDRLAALNRKHEAGETVDLQDAVKVLAETQQAVTKAMPLGTSTTDPVDRSVRELLAEYWQQVNTRKNTATTGFKSLNDALSGGFESQRLICVVGAPNCGKTTFTHQIADHAACSGRPVLYVTSEDTPSTLLAKTLARIGQVNYTAVLKGYESEHAKINTALAMQLDRQSSDRLRYLDASNGVTLDTIRDKAQAHFAQYDAEHKGGPGILVVDYLQRVARAIKTMGGMSQDLREVVTLVTERLRAIACELDCTVIAIASQGRTSYNRSGDMGALASPKESGDIEYTCDVLLSLSEDRDQKRKVPPGMVPVMLYVDKNRQGQRGKIISLNFWPDRQDFSEVGQ